MRLSISGEYQTRPYWLQTYVKDTGLPAHLYVKVLTVSVDVQDIYSGAALRVFSSEPYTTRTFPIVCSIEFSPYLPSATEQQTFIATDPPDIEFNISALVERAKHITTKLEKIGIILSSHDNEPPPPVQQLSGRSGLYNHRFGIQQFKIRTTDIFAMSLLHHSIPFYASHHQYQML
ncbi:hypothetical protein GGF41_004295 [Coemansia sp. RSA 2531]|nr:hypothetical protein GGF41_004295 [Coemansia sp. RSA 2531]